MQLVQLSNDEQVMFIVVRFKYFDDEEVMFIDVGVKWSSDEQVMLFFRQC